MAFSDYSTNQEYSAPPSDDEGASFTESARSVKDPYYSNEEIAILHSIVAAAEERVNHGRDPKPLPVAALFQAYDDILPEYGIDPDEDKHFSAFIFRIGGEEEHETLGDKFQAILGRMGIALEFGDDTSASLHNSSRSQEDGQSTRPLETRKGDTSASVTVPPVGIRRYEQPKPTVTEYESDETKESSGSPESTRPADQHNHNGVEDSWDDSSFDADPEVEAALQAARQVAAANALDRWRDAVAARHPMEPEAVSRAKDGKQAPASHPPVAPSNGMQGVHFKSDRLFQQLQPVEETTAEYRLDERPQPFHPSAESRIPTQQRRSLLSALDIWRHSKEQHKGQAASAQAPGATGTRPGVTTTKKPLTLPAATDATSPQDVGGTWRRSLERAVAKSNKPLETPKQAQKLTAAAQAEEQRMQAIAARAREIFLASKVFNHWADKTARRLEREAVARRHMIRFRCFHAWSQLPTSRLPEVDRLRVVTASQKLKRAVAENEEQLRISASASYNSHRSKKVTAVLDRWRCVIRAADTRQKVALRERLNTARRWMRRADNDASLEAALHTHRHLMHNLNALIRWQGKAELGAARQQASVQLGFEKRAHDLLRIWWDQAEVGRRAQAYRRAYLMDKASHAFDLWNLRARAQAFKWRNEYVSASRTFDLWEHRANANVQQQRVAAAHYELRARARVLSTVRTSISQRAQLTRRNNNARLYICATRLLDVVQKTVARRQAQDKATLRKRLEEVYRRFSKEKKKRSCLAAVDRWRAAATHDQHEFDRASRIRATKEQEHRVAMLDTWAGRTIEHQQTNYQMRLRHAVGFLNSWSEQAVYHQEQDGVARETWIFKKRSRYQKTWSNSAIQQGGQAHTAVALSRRYARSSRNKAFQRWRGQCLQDETIAVRQTPARASLGRSSLMHTTSRMPSARTAQYGMDTPSKGTWQPQLAASGIFARTMPPLREADEDQSPLLSPTGASSGAQLEQGPRRFPRLLPATPNVASSTTPRGPPPAIFGNEVAIRPRAAPSALRPAQSASQSSMARPVLATPSRPANAGSRTQPASAQHPLRFASTQRPLFSTPGPRTEQQERRPTPPRSLFESYGQRRSASPTRRSPTKEREERESSPDIYSDGR
ncbi:uncharacterized protein F5Z01DRAFT_646647 [Emericellopsis atlantica]|uniref:Sfi1 spindle body domain-containing protein n=1 Tax=Emericellopsis atlantica TaxID=2614577 RepID=A0A9P7ZTQ8_9HYPO|nr:uncharacterized protein F5Z01DRAFT_646647 [Emericellopsis atlantica]KAG9257661.1 hypothetical protein F5Z01DRAFT_646647 [Emericellopsis atlantica]